MTVTVRPAASRDTDIVHNLGEHVEEFKTSSETVTFWPKHILAAAIESSEAIVLVAEQDDSIVGFIIGNCNRALSKALIENIFVQPASREHGIGTQLVKEFVGEATTRGYEFISVLTPPNDTPAIKAYQNAGFEVGETFLWLDYIVQKSLEGSNRY